MNFTEVRPALHMDNLVSIYKNMEAASGTNIFVTQNPCPIELSGEFLYPTRNFPECYVNVSFLKNLGFWNSFCIEVCFRSDL